MGDYVIRVDGVSADAVAYFQEIFDFEDRFTKDELTKQRRSGNPKEFLGLLAKEFGALADQLNIHSVVEEENVAQTTYDEDFKEGIMSNLEKLRVEARGMRSVAETAVESGYTKEGVTSDDLYMGGMLKLSERSDIPGFVKDKPVLLRNILDETHEERFEYHLGIMERRNFFKDLYIPREGVADDRAALHDPDSPHQNAFVQAVNDEVPAVAPDSVALDDKQELVATGLAPSTPGAPSKMG